MARIKDTQPLSAEVVWEFDLREQGSRLRQFAAAGIPEPTTPEEKRGAKLLTNRLIKLTGDPIIDELDSAVVSMADQYLMEGHISQLQYLSIIEAADHKLTPPPESYISKFGSIYEHGGKK